MYFIIGESLQEVSEKDLQDTDRQYVAVVSFEEWSKSRDNFEMGISGRHRDMFTHRDSQPSLF